MPRKYTRRENFYIQRYGDAADYILSLKAKDRNSLPWTRAIQNMRQRCRISNANKASYYCGAGIKCSITGPELRDLFFKSKAWKLKIPSVDRINPEESYTKENVRWIEFEENRKQRLMQNPYRREHFLRIKNIITKELKDLNWPVYVQKAFLRACFKEMFNTPETLT